MLLIIFTTSGLVFSATDLMRILSGMEGMLSPLQIILLVQIRNASGYPGFDELRLLRDVDAQAVGIVPALGFAKVGATLLHEVEERSDALAEALGIEMRATELAVTLCHLGVPIVRIEFVESLKEGVLMPFAAEEVAVIPCGITRVVASCIVAPERAVHIPGNGRKAHVALVILNCPIHVFCGIVGSKNEFYQ